MQKGLKIVIISSIILAIFVSGYFIGKIITLRNQPAENPPNSEQEEDKILIPDVDIYSISEDHKWIIYVISNNVSDPNLIANYLYASNIEACIETCDFKIAQTVFETSFGCSFIGDLHHLLYGVKGVNAPFSYVALYDLDKKTNKYLLEGKDDKDYAFFYAVSEDERYLAYVGGKDGVFPDSTASLWLKDLKTGEEKILVKGDDVNNHDKYIEGPEFISSSEIQYSINTLNSSTYFVVDFNGHVRPADDKDSQ